MTGQTEVISSGPIATLKWNNAIAELQKKKESKNSYLEVKLFWYEARNGQVTHRKFIRLFFGPNRRENRTKNIFTS